MEKRFLIFLKQKKLKKDESYIWRSKKTGSKIYEITRKYESSKFTTLGQKINVYVKSIGIILMKNIW